MPEAGCPEEAEGPAQLPSLELDVQDRHPRKRRPAPTHGGLEQKRPRRVTGGSPWTRRAPRGARGVRAGSAQAAPSAAPSGRGAGRRGAPAATAHPQLQLQRRNCLSEAGPGRQPSSSWMKMPHYRTHGGRLLPSPTRSAPPFPPNDAGAHPKATFGRTGAQRCISSVKSGAGSAAR